MLTLRIPRDLARRLDAKAPAGERSAFVARAIERALDGESEDYAAGHHAGYRAGHDDGFRFMYERSKIDRGCYQDALILVRDGMDIGPALRKAFEANPEMQAYEAEVKAAQRRTDREQ